MDIYISADIEADGPIPGRYSMLAFGLVVAGTYDGHKFSPRELTKDTYYRELKPVTQHFDPAALDVSGLDREALIRDGVDPRVAMQEAAQWVHEIAQSHRPVLVGYPIVFDWMFLHWYFINYAGESPFGFSNALDIKTMYQQKAKVTLDKSGRRDLPAEFASARRHTHNALDDAIEQAEIFIKLFQWEGR